jgi:uncharacterized protein (TIGR02147 family)
METVSVYNYQDPRQFVRDWLTQRQKVSPDYSLRQLSKDVGFKSHALLVMLLQGKRPLKVRHAPLLANGMKLTSHERLYFQTLIQFDSAIDPDEKQLCSLWLANIHPAKAFNTREVDEFMVIAHWVHMTILTMTKLKGFQGSAEEIQRRLRKKVSIHEIHSAIERLTTMGLLKKHSDGRLEAIFARVTTRDDIANKGARKYHKGVMELASDAVEEQPVDIREYQSFSVAVDRDKIPLAKEMIRKFRAQLELAVRSEAGDEVYQTNIQFFQLTESPTAKHST